MRWYSIAPLELTGRCSPALLPPREATAATSLSPASSLPPGEPASDLPTIGTASVAWTGRSLAQQDGRLIGWIDGWSLATRLGFAGGSLRVKRDLLDVSGTVTPINKQGFSVADRSEWPYCHIDSQMTVDIVAP